LGLRHYRGEILATPAGDENLFNRRGAERRVTSEALNPEPKRSFG
jgi:hypothetical protein